MKLVTDSHSNEVTELLLLWEESRDRGETLTADDLCRDRPHLRDEVANRIRVLEAVYRVPNRAPSDANREETESPAFDALPQNVPGFEILGVLGRGGMGVVYKARHARLNRWCALKMLRYDRLAGPMERLRFRVEAEAVAMLQHPNIVQLYEVGEVGNSPYMVLEYVDGCTLAERIRDYLVGISEAVDLIEKLAQAVDYAHRHGIIHRDLKPGNVLLSFSRRSRNGAEAPRSERSTLVPGERLNESVPKIADFGLAKCLSDGRSENKAEPHTVTGAVFGTPAYMAPEQASGQTRQVGPATDVYSLGTILYEALTGRPPFQADSVLELLECVRSEHPTPLRRLRPDVPRDLEIICLKCLEKEPDRRYATAGALADDLRRFVSHEPIQARPAGWWEHAAKWARRRPAIATLLAIVVGLLFVMAFGGTTLAIIAMRATRDAVESAKQEKNAKETAQTREKETSAVLNFVESKIFAAARPEGETGGLGRNVSLRKALEAAMPFVEESFANEPLIEARLRMILGISFAHLGHAKAAETQCLRARELYTVVLGPNDPMTLSSINNLALSYYALGRHKEALTLHEETLALRKAKLGHDHADTRASMINLANSYYALNWHQEALELREEIFRLEQAKHGPHHRDTLRSMNNLANSYSALKRLPAALELYERTFQLQTSYLGSDHPDLLRTRMNLANCLRDLNRPGEALIHDQETLRLKTVKFGPDHPFTLESMVNLGTSYAVLGKHEEALKLREETLELLKSKRGLDHPHTLGCMWNVAANLVDLNRDMEALPIVDDCLKRATGKAVDPRLVPEVMDLRLRIFQKQNNARGCQATAEMWEKLNRSDAESLYTAAGMRAVTAAVIAQAMGDDATRLSDEQAGRAIEWLKKAVAAGYNDAARIADGKDFDVLRNREDFGKLLADTASGTNLKKK